MITRNQYMTNEATHKQYYEQFVNQAVKNAVLQYIGKDKIMASTDEHLNDIPLRRWDAISLPELAVSMKDCGDYLTASVQVCILKAAAKMIKEGR